MKTETDIDIRLVEACAACLCWAEWSTHEGRADDPWSYWQTVAPEAKQRYMVDARRVAALLASNKIYALVPAASTPEIRQAGIDAGRL